MTTDAKESWKAAGFGCGCLIAALALGPPLAAVLIRFLDWYFTFWFKRLA